MAISAKVIDADPSGKTLYVCATLTFSGNYTTGGDTLDLTTLIGQQYLSKVAVFGKLPLYGFISGSTSGFLYSWIVGTTLSNGKVQITGQQPTSATTGIIALSELAAGAYPAGITGDTAVTAEFAFDLLL
jgi:hypothetical protein